MNDEQTIESRILQARDTLYEEELFHELVREARATASYGVTTRQNLIRIPASDTLEILLDLVDVDEPDLQSDQDISKDGSRIAEGLSHTIRILLSYAHRQNLRRRTLLPLPLTSRKRSIPEHQLFRPALAYTQHMSHVLWLQSFLKAIFGVLQSAALDIPPYTNHVFSTKWAPNPSAPTVEAVVERFLTPFESTFSGKLLTPRGSFSITIRTSLSSPPFGTSFDVSCSMPNYPDNKSPGRLVLREEVEAAITHLFLLDVVFTASSAGLAQPKPEKNSQENHAWEAIYPQHGELVLSSSNLENHRKIKIALSRHELSLQKYTVRCFDGTGRGNWEQPSKHPTQYTWGTHSACNQSLMAVVSETSI
jgi:mediator of RNA polymerase II transcription subunit 17